MTDNPIRPHIPMKYGTRPIAHNTNVEIIVRMAEDLDLPDLNGSSLYPAFF